MKTISLGSFLIFLNFLITAGCVGGVLKDKTTDKGQSLNLKSVRAELIRVNKSLDQDFKYHVDVDIYFIKNNTKVSWRNLKKQIEFAQNTFAKASVELNFNSFKEISLAPSERSVQGVMPQIKPQNIKFYLKNPYKKMERTKAYVPSKTLDIFKKIIVDDKNDLMRISVIVGLEVLYSYYALDHNEYALKTDPTGGFSFPSYSLEDRIPRVYKGVISVSRDDEDFSLLAHELGHKLINVSHEGKEVCPQFVGFKVPGLLGYNGESDIFNGREGRYHKERLHKSPYLYTLSPKNKNQSGNKIRNQISKVYNRDYKKNGIYADPIYGSYFMEKPCF